MPPSLTPMVQDIGWVSVSREVTTLPAISPFPFAFDVIIYVSKLCRQREHMPIGAETDALAPARSFLLTCRLQLRRAPFERRTHDVVGYPSAARAQLFAAGAAPDNSTVGATEIRDLGQHTSLLGRN